MIQSFKSKGLQELFETGDSRRITPNWKPRLKLQLAQLNVALVVQDMDLPGWNLHALSGDLAGKWAVKVTANFRLTFEFEDGDAYVVDVEDYH